MKIFIDQGHNPENPNAGAEGNGFREQDIVYEIGQRTASLLRSYGFEVRLSRPTPDTQLGTSNASSLAERVNAANTWGADYFISLHTNASEITAASGSEAYVYRRDSEAEALACAAPESAAAPSAAAVPQPASRDPARAITSATERNFFMFFFIVVPPVFLFLFLLCVCLC